MYEPPLLGTFVGTVKSPGVQLASGGRFASRFTVTHLTFKLVEGCCTLLAWAAEKELKQRRKTNDLAIRIDLSFVTRLLSARNKTIA